MKIARLKEEEEMTKADHIVEISLVVLIGATALFLLIGDIAILVFLLRQL